MNAQFVDTVLAGNAPFELMFGPEPVSAEEYLFWELWRTEPLVSTEILQKLLNAWMKSSAFIQAPLREDLVTDEYPPLCEQNLERMLSLVSQYDTDNEQEEKTLTKVLFFFLNGYISTFSDVEITHTSPLFKTFNSLWQHLRRPISSKTIGRTHFTCSVYTEPSEHIPEPEEQTLDLCSYMGLLLEQLLFKFKIMGRGPPAEELAFDRLWKEHCAKFSSDVAQAREFRVQYFFS